jgi:hypothetical protein
MRIRRLSYLAGIFAIILAEMACTLNIGGPAYPTPAIPISTEAMGDLQSGLETAISNGAGSGQVTLNITEPQLTSYLSYTLQDHSKPFITHPQVYLRDGELQVYGTITQGYFQANVRIILSAGVDDQGQLKIGLNSANFGPLPIPNGLTEIVTAAVQEAYTGALGPVATGFRLQSVTITDGSMTIVGQIK